LKESKETSGTYELESTERGTIQDTERRKESKQARDTHGLWGTEKRTSKETEKLCGGHSLSGERRGEDKSEWQQKGSEKEALTYWMAQREGHVRTVEEHKRANGTSGTHCLESAEGRRSQGTIRKRTKE
jgi:hypothetical protein